MRGGGDRSLCRGGNVVYMYKIARKDQEVI